MFCLFLSYFVYIVINKDVIILIYKVLIIVYLSYYKFGCGFVNLNRMVND